MKQPTNDRDIIKNKRFSNFILVDKDPYICYRFVLALEKLMPKSLTQIKEIILDDLSDTADKMIIETTPRAVYERYVWAAGASPLVDHDQFEKIQALGHMFARYLSSNGWDRVEYYKENQKEWDKFI